MNEAGGIAGIGGLCRRCARRGWLLSRLSGALDQLAGDPPRLWATLELEDRDLIAAFAGGDAQRSRLSEQWESWFAGESWHANRICAQRGMFGEMRAACRHHCRYPERLREDPLAPHALAVSRSYNDDTGCGERDGSPDGLSGRRIVAIAGARAPSAYGIGVARAFAAELAAAGVTVAGSAARVGAVARAAAAKEGGRTLYAAGASSRERDAASTRPAGEKGHEWLLTEPVVQRTSGRWLDLAAERTLALIADLVLVPQAHAEDGLDLACAEVARSRGMPVAVVPGPVDSPASRGSNRLLASGAHVVCDARQALDPLFGVGSVVAGAPGHRYTGTVRGRAARAGHLR